MSSLFSFFSSSSADSKSDAANNANDNSTPTPPTLQSSGGGGGGGGGGDMFGGMEFRKSEEGSSSSSSSGFGFMASSDPQPEVSEVSGEVEESSSSSASASTSTGFNFLNTTTSSEPPESSSAFAFLSSSSTDTPQLTTAAIASSTFTSAPSSSSSSASFNFLNSPTPAEDEVKEIKLSTSALNTKKVIKKKRTSTVGAGRPNDDEGEDLEPVAKPANNNTNTKGYSSQTSTIEGDASLGLQELGPKTFPPPASNPEPPPPPNRAAPPPPFVVTSSTSSSSDSGSDRPSEAPTPVDTSSSSTSSSISSTHNNVASSTTSSSSSSSYSGEQAYNDEDLELYDYASGSSSSRFGGLRGKAASPTKATAAVQESPVFTSNSNSTASSSSSSSSSRSSSSSSSSTSSSISSYPNNIDYNTKTINANTTTNSNSNNNRSMEPEPVAVALSAPSVSSEPKIPTREQFHADFSNVSRKYVQRQIYLNDTVLEAQQEAENIDKNLINIARQVEEKNEELAKFVSEEDFESADGAEQALVVLNSNMATLKSNQTTLEIRIIEFKRQAVSNIEDQMAALSSLSSRLSEMSGELSASLGDLKLDIDTDYESEMKRLRIERDRVALELQHVSKDEASLNEETKLIDDSINLQSNDLLSAKADLELKCLVVDKEILELESQLAKKKVEAKKLAGDLDAAVAKINDVRKKYDRQLQRLQDRRDSIVKTKQECTDENDSIVRNMQATEALRQNKVRQYKDAELWVQHLSKEVVLGGKVKAALTEIFSSESSSSETSGSSGSGSTEEESVYRSLQGDCSRAVAALEAASKHHSELVSENEDLLLRIRDIDEKLPKWEAEKKAHATAKRFKEAAASSKEIKDKTSEKESFEVRMRAINEELTSQEGVIAGLKADFDAANKRLLEVKSKADIKRFHDLTAKCKILKKCSKQLHKTMVWCEGVQFSSLATCCHQIIENEMKYLSIARNAIKEKHSIEAVEDEQEEEEDGEDEEIEVEEIKEKEVEIKEDEDGAEEVEIAATSANELTDYENNQTVADPVFDVTTQSNSEVVGSQPNEDIAKSIERSVNLTRAQLLAKSIDELNEQIAVATEVEDFELAAALQEQLDALDPELNALLDSLNCDVEFVRAYQSDSSSNYNSSSSSNNNSSNSTEEDVVVESSSSSSSSSSSGFGFSFIATSSSDPSPASYSPPTKEIVFVIGCPGAGKTVNCRKLADAHDDVLSVDYWATSEQRSIIDYLRDLITANPSKSRFLLEGFPRRMEDVSAWDQKQASGELAEIDAALSFVLYFSCPHDVLIERSRVDGRVSGDDDEGTLLMALIDHKNDCDPVVQHFTALGLLREVSADEEEEVVFEFAAEYLYYLT